jgi:hypothetical protein
LLTAYNKREKILREIEGRLRGRMGVEKER